MESLLHVVIWKLGDAIDRDQESGAKLSGTPSDFDRRVFDVVAKSILQLTDTKRRDALWKSILALGPTAHYWVEDFIASWFMDGFPRSGDTREFFALWRKMIEYALQLPNWKKGAGCGWHHLHSVWASLMGMRLGAGVLRDCGECAASLLQMVDLYSAWAADWLKDAWALRDFAHLITCPAGSALLRAALPWLAKAAVQIAEHTYHFTEASQALSEACVRCWAQDRTSIERTPELRQAFLELLELLIKHQQPEALQLRDELLSSQGR